MKRSQPSLNAMAAVELGPTRYLRTPQPLQGGVGIHRGGGRPWGGSHALAVLVPDEAHRGFDRVHHVHLHRG